MKDENLTNKTDEEIMNTLNIHLIRDMSELFKKHSKTLQKNTSLDSDSILSCLLYCSLWAGIQPFWSTVNHTKENKKDLLKLVSSMLGEILDLITKQMSNEKNKEERS